MKKYFLQNKLSKKFLGFSTSKRNPKDCVSCLDLSLEEWSDKEDVDGFVGVAGFDDAASANKFLEGKLKENYIILEKEVKPLDVNNLDDANI